MSVVLGCSTSAGPQNRRKIKPGSGTRAVIDQALAACQAQARDVALVLSATEAIKRAVAAGLGLAVVSRLCVGLELAGGLLIEVPVRDLKLRRPLHELSFLENAPLTADERTPERLIKTAVRRLNVLYNPFSTSAPR